jgi:XTP/dITP diphosphohydrolase
MQKILLATNNPGKVLEIKSLLADLSITLLTPGDLGLVLEVPEDGENYAANAAKKAAAFALASGLTALGDDSGLEVDALGGLPGLHSHRFSPDPDAAMLIAASIYWNACQLCLSHGLPVFGPRWRWHCLQAR